MTKLRTHYDNLKVSRDAPDAVIRAAYKALAQKYHPDKNPGDAQAARIMKIINQSYEVLSDSGSRARHDAWIISEETEQASHDESPDTRASYSPPPPPPEPPHKPSRNTDGPSNNKFAITEKGFWRKLLDGDFGLAKTYWLFGVLPAIALNVLVGVVETTPTWLLLVVLFHLVYWMVVAIGCWRAATQYQGFVMWPVLVKFFLGIGWIIIPVEFLIYTSLLFDPPQQFQPEQSNAAPIQSSIQLAQSPPHLTAPARNDDAGWKAYLPAVVQENMGTITNSPFLYYLPPESDPDFQAKFRRQVDAATQAMSRGVQKDNLLAFGSPASARMAELMEAAFKDVPADSMTGVRILFIGDAVDNLRVQTVMAPTGAEYVFVEAR